MQKHVGDIKVKCEFCDIKFTQRFLLNHRRTCVKNPNIVHCDKCDTLLNIDEYEIHRVMCDRLRENMLKNGINDRQSPDNCEIEVLTNILLQLANKLNYRNVEEMLNQYDMICPVCYEPTDNKTNTCSHSICIKCLKKVILSTNPKCPTCRTNL